MEIWDVILGLSKTFSDRRLWPDDFRFENVPNKRLRMRLALKKLLLNIVVAWYIDNTIKFEDALVSINFLIFCKWRRHSKYSKWKKKTTHKLNSKGGKCFTGFQKRILKIKLMVHNTFYIYEYLVVFEYSWNLIFQVGWYNDLVGEKYKLPYHKNALGLLVLSIPDMWEKAFIPFVQHQHWDELHDPLHQCMIYYFDRVNQVE